MPEILSLQFNFYFLEEVGHLTNKTLNDWFWMRNKTTLCLTFLERVQNRGSPLQKLGIYPFTKAVVL